MGKVEIIRLEFPGLLEAFPIVDRQLAALQGDQPFGSERLKHAVDVHGRKTQRVAKFFLRQGQPGAAPDARPTDLKRTRSSQKRCAIRL